jgi:uncharacterized protein (AIM24 family)
MAAGPEGDIERDAARAARRSVPPPASSESRDVANEDFLFHLYRGSELLQDNRILEAKTELEFALMLQPRDPKGQDLLALVYFRIGHYPRAIQIYEELLRANPGDPALQLNLALCYLKTGQPYAARAELEQVVQSNSGHRRAWGYLGLAYERVGDFEKAVHAFERGGHSAMAKRMAERAQVVARASVPPPPPSVEAAEVRAAAAVAFEELDAGELSFALAEPETSKGGTWLAVEPGAATVAPEPHVSPSPPRRRRHDTLDWGIPKSGAGEQLPASTMPRSVADMTREALLAFPQTEDVAMLRTGVALVRTVAGEMDRDFAVRLEAVRSIAGELATTVLQRHTRGQSTQETLGGVATPIVRISGSGQLVLGPLPSHKILAFTMRGEVAFVREELLLGFALSLSFENGRLAVGDGEGAQMVQLRGMGTVLLEMRESLAALEVTAMHAVTVRREVLVGWVGRLVPRGIPISEAPCGQRGLVSLAGDGTVLLAAR